MYRVYGLTDNEKEKITRLRWDGDTHYYDVFESQGGNVIRNRRD